MNTNIYNPYVRREMELYHHGINGQKWGKRNGPPYPLGKSKMSYAERQAVKYKKKELKKIDKHYSKEKKDFYKNSSNYTPKQQEIIIKQLSNMQDIEKTYVMSMSIDDVRDEKIHRGKNLLNRILSSGMANRSYDFYYRRNHMSNSDLDKYDTADSIRRDIITRYDPVKRKEYESYK